MATPTLDDFGMIERADSITRLFLDCVLSEEHRFESEVTDYPTESGGSFSDNIRPRSDIVSIEAIVSDAPFGPIRTVRGASAKTAGNEAEEFLLRIRKDREPVTLRVSKRTYRNMAMESLVITRNKDTGGPNALKFSATFKQIRTVTNQRTQVKRTSLQGGGGKTKLGMQTATYAGPKVVLWRKGIASRWPGGKFIYKGGAERIGDSEYVHYLTHEEMKERNMELHSTVIKLVDAGFANQAGEKKIPDGAWFHGAYTFTGTGAGEVRSTNQTNAARKPLTTDEYRRFKLDMARDNDPEFRRRLESENAARAAWPELYVDQSPDKTKTPVDLNRTNQKGTSKPKNPLDDNSYSRAMKQ